MRIRAGHVRRAVAAVLLLAAALTVGVSSVAARPEAKAAATASGTITMLLDGQQEVAWREIFANFEKAYPSITVNPTYVPTSSSILELLPTELAAGNAPDLLETIPGLGTTVSVQTLAKDGYLAPIVKPAWNKYTIPLIAPLDSYKGSIYAFEPDVDFYGLFWNTALMSKYGLKIPTTFPQFLSLCSKAKADGVVANAFAGSPAAVATGTTYITTIAGGTVLSSDPNWDAQRATGKVTFAGTPGWHTAVQDLVTMANDGCFETGYQGISSPQAIADFAAGQELSFGVSSGNAGGITADNPNLQYVMYPFPSGTSSKTKEAEVNPDFSLSINAKSTNRAAALTFINFLARPGQDALYAKLLGVVTQVSYKENVLPPILAGFKKAALKGQVVVGPISGWWNSSVLGALLTDASGIPTGQISPDAVLAAMDTAWDLGPS